MITKSAKNTRFYKVDPKKELADQFAVLYKLNPRGRKVKALIIYDSVYGNTKRIAEAIASSISAGVKLLHVNDYKDEELKSINLLRLFQKSSMARDFH